MSIIDQTERSGRMPRPASSTIYAKAVEASERFRKEYEDRLNVVKSSEMPFDVRPTASSSTSSTRRWTPGSAASTSTCSSCRRAAPAASTATSRRRSFYVVEGSGYDLHWDVRFDCKDKFEWSWDEEPKRFEWGQGDFIYIPPYCAHRHVNADAKNETRIIVINSRILKPMGFDWFEQLENAEGF